MTCDQFYEIFCLFGFLSTIYDHSDMASIKLNFIIDKIVFFINYLDKISIKYAICKWNFRLEMFACFLLWWNNYRQLFLYFIKTLWNFVDSVYWFIDIKVFIWISCEVMWNVNDLLRYFQKLKWIRKWLKFWFEKK